MTLKELIICLMLAYLWSFGLFMFEQVGSLAYHFLLIPFIFSMGFMASSYFFKRFYDPEEINNDESTK